MKCEFKAAILDYYCTKVPHVEITTAYFAANFQDKCEQNHLVEIGLYNPMSYLKIMCVDRYAYPVFDGVCHPDVRIRLFFISISFMCTIERILLHIQMYMRCTYLQMIYSYYAISTVQSFNILTLYYSKSLRES